MGTLADSPLGRATHYPDGYDPGLLYATERAPQRQALGLATPLPFHGADDWTAWEAYWLDADGLPQVGIVTFSVTARSPCIVESKSVKLYFASLNFARFATAAAVRAAIARDLAAATGADVPVRLARPERWSRLARRAPAGIAIDGERVACHPAEPDRSCLTARGANVDETLLTRTFRSTCPVTGQPDYACVQIGYRGPRIDRRGLRAYLLGYRRHPGFHEHCVERIFVDVQQACRPAALVVRARFTRRGGVDINPWRASAAGLVPNRAPTLRQ